MKKTVIIISIILGILALGAGVYFAWQKSKEILEPPTIGQRPIVDNQRFGIAGGASATSTSGQSQFQKGKLALVNNNEIYGYWLYNTTTSVKFYFLSRKGEILQEDGEPATDRKIENFQSLKTSPNGVFALIKSGGLLNPRFDIFRMDNLSWSEMANIRAAAFSPDSQKIAYFDNSGNLFTKELLNSKSKPVKVISLGLEDYDLNWINQENIVLLPKPASKYQSQAWFLDIKNKTLAKLISGLGLMINWASDGKTAIAFKVDENNSPSLALMNEKGQLIANLDFFTLPGKCHIAPGDIYCALPQYHNSTEEPELPDDYLKKSFYYTDFIYRINLKENSFEPVFTGKDPAFDIAEPKLYGDKLYFINRYDDKLYTINLTNSE